MKILGVVVILAMLSFPVLAQEHLDPDDLVIGQLLPNGRIFDDGLLLKPAFDNSVRVFAVMEPSFSPEVVVGLKERGNGYVIFGAQPVLTKDRRMIPENPDLGPVKLYGPDGKRLPKNEEDSLLANMPVRDGTVRLDRCEAPIDTALAKRIIVAWDKVVLQTRTEPDMPSMGLDGVVEHFASVLRYRVAAGRIWSPQPPGNPGYLSRLAWNLSRICDGEEPPTKGWVEIDTALANIH